VLEAVRKAAPGASVAYSWNGRDIPKGAQAAIVVIGEQPYAEMKGDGCNWTRPAGRGGRQAGEAGGLPTIVVLFSGRPLILDGILPFADAIAAAWLPARKATASPTSCSASTTRRAS